MLTSNSKSLSFFNCVILYFCVVLCCQFEYCISQRNPPQEVSNSNDGSDLYTYGRGDIPIFNPLDLNKSLIAALRELIIAIQ